MTCTVPMKASASPDSTRFKVHRLCHLVLSQHPPTDVSFHSKAASREKPHLTRHHPCMHRTSRSSHTPRLKYRVYALLSTCIDVTIRPHCCELVVMEGHLSAISHFNRIFGAQRTNSTHLFLTNQRRRNKATFLYPSQKIAKTERVIEQAAEGNGAGRDGPWMHHVSAGGQARRRGHGRRRRVVPCAGRRQATLERRENNA